MEIFRGYASDEFVECWSSFRRHGSNNDRVPNVLNRYFFPGDKLGFFNNVVRNPDSETVSPFLDFCCH